MEKWNEIQTAAAVVKYGSIGKAAKELRIHRATVNRHLDRLESELGARLFLRHSRGMAPTDLGKRLQRVAEAAKAQFGDLYREAKSQTVGLDGTFVITSIDVLSPLILPMIKRFQETHEQLVINYVACDRVLKLAYGEADIAIRIGPKPQLPDNIVIPFRNIRMGLYASKAYLKKNGIPECEADFGAHRFIGPDKNTPHAPFIDWLKEHVDEDKLMLLSNSIAFMWYAVKHGSGIGFYPTFMADLDNDLVEVIAPQADWEEQTWLVTHVDLHHSDKVQAFLNMLRT